MSCPWVGLQFVIVVFLSDLLFVSECSISNGSVNIIIYEHLGMSKVSTQKPERARS